MSYTKTDWVNNNTPAINATNLNKIENGIYNIDAAIATLNTNIERVLAWTNLNPTLDFASQIINLNYKSGSTRYNFDDYNYYEILFKQSKNSVPQRMMSSGKIPTGHGTILSWANAYRATSTTASGTSIGFEDAKSAPSATIINSDIIPFKIFLYQN